MSTRNTIILAAGKGTRMSQNYIRFLHQVYWVTMVEHA